MAESQSENTSGQGSLAVIPQEIRQWNWGAFLLTFWWGIDNRVWDVLWMTLIPGVGFIMCFVLGVKGNEWAWQKRKWYSIEHFKSTQRKWAWWGLGAWGVVLVIGLVISLVAGLA